MARTASKAPRILTAEDIWGAKDIEERTVEIPQWGGAVRIRTLTKKQADEMQAKATSTDRYTKQPVVDNDMLVALLFVESMIEPSITLDDYERLRERSAVAVALLQREILAASGLSQLAVSEADKSDGTRSDIAIRVLPGTRTEDDEGGTEDEVVGE
jgi:hypothetical protein